MKKNGSKNLVFSADSVDKVEMLNDKEAGQLLKAMYRYVMDGEEMNTDNRVLYMVFEYMRMNIDKHAALRDRMSSLSMKRWSKKESESDAEGMREVCESDAEGMPNSMDCNAGKREKGKTCREKGEIDEKSGKNGREKGETDVKSGETDSKSKETEKEKEISPIASPFIEKEKDKEKVKEKEPPSIKIDVGEKRKDLGCKLENRMDKFREEVMAFRDIYPVEILQAFYDHWSEPNMSGSKMKWEKQETWELKRRLARWVSNAEKWRNGNGANRSDSAAREQRTVSAARNIEGFVLGDMCR